MLRERRFRGDGGLEIGWWFFFRLYFGYKVVVFVEMLEVEGEEGERLRFRV